MCAGWRTSSWLGFSCRPTAAGGAGGDAGGEGDPFAVGGPGKGGGGAFKVAPALKAPGFIKWSRVPLTSFFPVFDPDDPNRLLLLGDAKDSLRDMLGQVRGVSEGVAGVRIASTSLKAFCWR